MAKPMMLNRMLRIVFASRTIRPGSRVAAALCSPSPIARLSCRLLEWPGRPVADLRSVTQIMVGEHARHHGFADRDRADADAGVVAALGYDLGLVAEAVDGLARGPNGGGRLHGEARHDGLAGRDAAEDAAGVVRQEARTPVIAHAHFVGILLARHRGGREAVADLDTLHGVDAHQRAGKVGVELAVDRGTEPAGDVLGDHLDHGADRRALLPYAVEELLELGFNARVGAEEWAFQDVLPVPAGAVDLVRPDLDQRAAHHHAGHDLARNRARRDAGCGFARRLPSA